jgi:hypothetical protein
VAERFCFWYTNTMATKIYESETIKLLNGKEVLLQPLKLKYLREFMEIFEIMKNAKTDEDAMFFLSECIKIAMKQYCPELKNIYDIEDNLDLPTSYRILEIAANIKLNRSKKPQEAEEEGNTWESLDLAKLEAEAFLLGIWKDYEELESSISMPELMLTLSQKRELDYQEKRFLAGVQGIDLDDQVENKQNKWEEMKARVFSNGKTNDGNDILAYQGVNAQKAGFGINLGLSYEDLTKKDKK